MTWRTHSACRVGTLADTGELHSPEPAESRLRAILPALHCYDDGAQTAARFNGWKAISLLDAELASAQFRNDQAEKLGGAGR
jgi:hypothetical protein